MTDADKQALLRRLDAARGGLEKLLPGIDPHKEIYTGWTIRELLAHITGWDDATIASLRAHLAGQEPATPADRGIEEYNKGTVSTREDLDLDHVLKEFRQTRQELRQLLLDMPEEAFTSKLVVPWGETGTVTQLIEVFVGHEEEHTEAIHKWLRQPDRSLDQKER